MCREKKDENFGIYNLYYKNINKNTYGSYCKEINILMGLEGVIKQPR